MKKIILWLKKSRRLLLPMKKAAAFPLQSSKRQFSGSPTLLVNSYQFFLSPGNFNFCCKLNTLYKANIHRRIPAPLDLREEFIDELRRSGKLPLVQYEAYANACRELEKRCDSDNMDWKTSDGSPDFKSLMDRIAERVREKGKAFQLIKKLSGLLAEALPKPETTASLIEFSPDTIESDKKENNLPWDIGRLAFSFNFSNSNSVYLT